MSADGSSFYCGSTTSLTIVGHGQNGNLSNGTITTLDTSGTFVNGGQISVHVTRVTTTTGDFFSGGRDFTKGVAVRGKIGENDEDVLLELVGIVLGGGEGETRSDDTFDAGERGY